MGDQGRLGLVPLGALDAVVLAQGGQVLDELGVLVLLEVLGRQQVGLDLVDVPVFGLSVLARGRFGQGLVAHLRYRRVFVSVRLFWTPILIDWRA